MMAPAKRLASDPEAKAWLDTVVTTYAQRSGIQLSAEGAVGGGNGSQGATINNEESLKFQADQEQFAVQHIKLYMRYLKPDSCSGYMAFRTASQVGQYGDTYIEGIKPVFDLLKAGRFDSSWNCVRQDIFVVYYDIIFGRLTTVDREITARCIALLNRADPDLLTYMQYNINQCDASKGETYQLAKQFGQQLIENTREVIGQPPVYKDGKSQYCFCS